MAASAATVGAVFELVRIESSQITELGLRIWPIAQDHARGDGGVRIERVGQQERDAPHIGKPPHRDCRAAADFRVLGRKEPRHLGHIERVDLAPIFHHLKPRDLVDVESCGQGAMADPLCQTDLGRHESDRSNHPECKE